MMTVTEKPPFLGTGLAARRNSPDTTVLAVYDVGVRYKKVAVTWLMVFDARMTMKARL